MDTYIIALLKKVSDHDSVCCGLGCCVRLPQLVRQLHFIYQQPEYAIVSVVIVMLVMVTGRLFGVAEVELVSNKAMAIGKSFVRRRKKES